MLCVNHLFYPLGWFWAFGVQDTNIEDDELQVYLKWKLHFIDLLYTATQCTVTFVVQWDAHLPQVSKNIRAAKVCVPWFAVLSIEGHPNFLQNIFFCCWNDLLPFHCYSVFIFLLYSTLVSSFYLSVNIVVLYQFTVTCIEIWSVRSLCRIKSSRLRSFFDDIPDKIACSRPSTSWMPETGYREERNGFVKADVK